jgi:DNA replication protein DnaC
MREPVRNPGLTTNDFYDYAVERHARAASTIVTSNRDPVEWLAMTSDQLLAQAAVDRLTGHAHTLILNGPSYRQRPPAPGPLDPLTTRTG